MVGGRPARSTGTTGAQIKAERAQMSQNKRTFTLEEKKSAGRAKKSPSL